MRPTKNKTLLELWGKIQISWERVLGTMPSSGGGRYTNNIVEAEKKYILLLVKVKVKCYGNKEKSIISFSQ